MRKVVVNNRSECWRFSFIGLYILVIEAEDSLFIAYDWVSELLFEKRIYSCDRCKLVSIFSRSVELSCVDRCFKSVSACFFGAKFWECVCVISGVGDAVVEDEVIGGIETDKVSRVHIPRVLLWSFRAVLDRPYRLSFANGVCNFCHTSHVSCRLSFRSTPRRLESSRSCSWRTEAGWRRTQLCTN